MAGIDATTTTKGVVRIATQAEVDAGTPGVVPDASVISGERHELPIATASVLGGIMVGDGLVIDLPTGKLDVTLEQGNGLQGQR